MIDLQKYQRLKQRADKAKTDRERAEGALAEQKSRLKKEFDVDSLDAAQTLLTTLERERDETETNYNDAMKRFEEEFGDV